MTTLLSAAANGNGTSKEYRRTNDSGAWLLARGTWNSATAKLQYNFDGTNWVDVTDASFTADGMVRVFLPNGNVRGVVSGGGGSESINMELLK